MSNYILVVDNTDYYYSEDTRDFETYGDMINHIREEKPNVVRAFEVTREFSSVELHLSVKDINNELESAKLQALAKLSPQDRQLLGLSDEI